MKSKLRELKRNSWFPFSLADTTDHHTQVSRCLPNCTSGTELSLHISPRLMTLGGFPATHGHQLS